MKYIQSDPTQWIDSIQIDTVYYRVVGTIRCTIDRCALRLVGTGGGAFSARVKIEFSLKSEAILKWKLLMLSLKGQFWLHLVTTFDLDTYTQNNYL